MNLHLTPTILHFVSSWLPQTQTWIFRQVAELQRLGVATHVVCDRRENLDQFSLPHIHCLADEPRSTQILDRTMRLFRPRRHLNYVVSTGQKVCAHIVHTHFGHTGWVNSGAVAKLGAKHVVTFYGLDVNKLPAQSAAWRRRYKQLFEDVDLILCEGSHMANCIVALGCPAEKVAVQHLGVDVQNIDFAPRHWEPGTPFKALLAASFREKKGIPYAIEALAMLNKQIPVEITIIGDADATSESQHEKKKILGLLKQSGLASKTRLLGYQSHEVLFREASQHHVFVSPSVTASDGDTEGGAPVTIIEMAASGMPIVSTKHCDIPEVICHGTTGFLADERNVEQLYVQLRHLTGNPDQWATMLAAGRNHIELEYDAVIQGNRLAAFYQRLVEEP
jgi:colanic acid/amylovoran biosynthesis glycosyltransferase